MAVGWAINAKGLKRVAAFEGHAGREPYRTPDFVFFEFVAGLRMFCPNVLPSDTENSMEADTQQPILPVSPLDQHRVTSGVAAPPLNITYEYSANAWSCLTSARDH